MKGWRTSTREIRQKEALPEQALRYIKLLEDHIGIKIDYEKNCVYKP